MDLLSVDRLKKAYQSRGREPFWAVKGISFTLGPGECFGLLGPNGAGKSTSMNCITGFYQASEGAVRLMGFDVYAEPRQARQYLGVCQQEDTLDSDFNAFDQMVRYASFFEIPEAEARTRTQTLLNRFGLSDKAREMVEELSGGMRRRLQVARALVSQPRILVLDEPTAGLDPEARRQLWDIITEYRAQGNSILLSTHYMEEAERLCDRVAIMHQGLILDVAPASELIAKYIGTQSVEEEIRPGLLWKRLPNLEDVFLKLTGSHLQEDSEE
ncbi:MAG TPA: ABC transporter ATP-binding protein [Candidatus Ozemobacteraceae bacterium]|nr:ABC transporter ATP-binding protein [Candidatus Ozemobacteraceae bacterium]